MNTQDSAETIRTIHLHYRKRIGSFIMNRLEEVTNKNGGVIGYKLNLDSDETEKLIREIEAP